MQKCKNCNKKKCTCEVPCYEEGCAEKLDASCVFYHPENSKRSLLSCFLGLSNKVSLQTILEKLDTKLCDVIIQNKVQVSSTDTAASWLDDKLKVGDCLVKTITTDEDGIQAISFSLDLECVAQLLHDYNVVIYTAVTQVCGLNTTTIYASGCTTSTIEWYRGSSLIGTGTSIVVNSTGVYSAKCGGVVSNTIAIQNIGACSETPTPTPQPSPSPSPSPLPVGGSCSGITEFQSIGTFSSYPVVAINWNGTSNGWVPALVIVGSPNKYYVKGKNIFSHAQFTFVANPPSQDCFIPTTSDFGGNSFPSSLTGTPGGFTKLFDEGGFPYFVLTAAPVPLPLPVPTSSPVPVPNPIPPVPTSGLANLIIPYTLETTENTFNINQFSNMSLPSNHKFILGNGSPGFTEWQGSIPLKIYQIGVTHYGNNNAYTIPEAPNTNQYWFDGFTGTILNVCSEIQGAYPDVSNVFTSNFASVSRTSRLAIGLNCYYKRSTGYDYVSGTYARDSDFGYYLLDEEQFNGPGIVDFLGEVLEGWRSGQANSILNRYGGVANGFYLYNGLTNYPHGYSDAQILSYRDWYSVVTPGYRAAKATFDISGGYFRVPVVDTNIYKKSGSSFILDGLGRRQLRDDTFDVNLYTRTHRMWKEPDPEMKLYGVIPGPADWKTDVEWMLQEMYLFQDYLQLVMLGRSKYEFGDYDISRWKNYDVKADVTISAKTEFWTYGGNSHKIREVGEIGHLYTVLFAFFNGVNSYATWDIGFEGQGLGPANSTSGLGNKIRPLGEDLYPQHTDLNGDPYWNPSNPGYTGYPNRASDNYSRYIVLIAAMQTFAKLVQDNSYVFDTTLRYIRFNTPIYAFRNKEILCNGIYQNNKFSFVMISPYHNPECL